MKAELWRAEATMTAVAQAHLEASEAVTSTYVAPFAWAERVVHYRLAAETAERAATELRQHLGRLEIADAAQRAGLLGEGESSRRP
jgi:hypothetical protein